MNISGFYSTLCICAVAALLAGCSTLRPAQDDMSPSIGAPEGSITHALSRHLTFQYTGAEQTFKVPAGVTSISARAATD